MSSVVTSQPRAQEAPENQPADVNTTLTEQEQEEARKRENRDAAEEFCCCVLDVTEETWCLCRCIAWCLHGMGQCMYECCEGCAKCCEAGIDADEDCFGCDCSD